MNPRSVTATMVSAAQVCQSYVISGGLEKGDHLKYDQRGDGGEDGHENKLSDGPFPGTGFPGDDGGGGEALKGVDVEDEEGDDGGRGEHGASVGPGFRSEGVADMIAGFMFVV